MSTPVSKLPVGFAVFIIVGFVIAWHVALAESRLGPRELDEIAIEVNPQVRAARARWYSAMHSVKQNYAPQDPILGYANIDSPTNGFSHASVHTLTVSESFQFPGKALLQASVARRAADIARLNYLATVRDVRAETETAYYQIILDSSLAAVQSEIVTDLTQVLKVTQVAYAANRVTQTDFISAEFDLVEAQQNERHLRITELNDRTTLNQLLFRRPDEPVNLDRSFALKRVDVSLDRLIAMASHFRQEILAAALTQKNQATALALAKLEYAPDYTVGYTFDNYLLASGAPASVTKSILPD